MWTRMRLALVGAVVLVVCDAARLEPSNALRKAWLTNTCAMGGCLNEELKCQPRNQCGPRTANVTLSYSGLRDQLIGAATNYTKLSAPSRPMGVDFTLTVHKVYAVDANRATVELGVTQQLRWEDTRLRWDPSAFEGVSTLFLACNAEDPTLSEIWAPGVELWNVAQRSKLSNERCYVLHNGTVVWSRPGMMKASCDMNIAKFPFDKPSCLLQFGSWGQSSKYLYLRPLPWTGGISLSATSKSGGEMWITSATAKGASIVLYSAQPNWQVVQVNMALERAYQYYTTRFMVPQMVLTLASFACVSVPASSNERLTLGSVLLVIVLLLQAIGSSAVPMNAGGVLMGSFMTLNAYYCFAALLLSLMSVSLYNKADRQLFSCLIRAPARWRPPTDVRTKAEIEIAQKHEIEKMQRSSVETDLSIFLKQNNMGQFEAAFRDQEIHNIEELIECRLNEHDLRDVLHIEPLFARKSLARKIRDLYPKDDSYHEEECNSSMDPILSTLIQNIQDSKQDEDEEDEAEFVAIVGKAPPPPEPEAVSDPDHAFDDDDYTEYWRHWSTQLDRVARFLLPVAFIVHIVMDVGGDTFGKLI